MEADKRIVVCGAGVIGAAVAYFLAVRGAAPIVVERAQPGAAASGRAGGFLALDWNDGGALEPLARASYHLHAELAATLPDYGYRQVETLLVAGMDEGDVTRYGKLPNPPWLDGNVALHSVIGTTATTAQVTPLAFTQALIAAAVEHGAQLMTGVVEGLDLRADDGAVQGVHVDGARVPADTVVLALGPWMAKAQGWVPLPIIHGLKAASITLAADIPAQAVFGDYLTRDGRTLTPEIYPRPNGEVYVNGFPETGPLPDDPDAIEPSAFGCDELQRIAAAHSSILADAPVTSRRACYRPVTTDGVPLIGPIVGAPGVYVATGHSAWGILNAPATGRMVAEMILDGHSHSVDAIPYAPNRLPAAMV